jgi:hypothetical protein
MIGPSAVAHISVIPGTLETEIGGFLAKSDPGKSTRPYLKNKRTKSKRTRCMVECLPSKFEALSSIPSAAPPK